MPEKRNVLITFNTRFRKEQNVPTVKGSRYTWAEFAWHLRLEAARQAVGADHPEIYRQRHRSARANAHYLRQLRHALNRTVIEVDSTESPGHITVTELEDEAHRGQPD